MTRDPEQATADLRRAVRRLVEEATAEQLEAMREAWGDAGPDLFAEDVLVLRPDDAMAEVTGLMSHALALAFEDDCWARAADPLAELEGREPQRYSPPVDASGKPCPPAEAPWARNERPAAYNTPAEPLVFTARVGACEVAGRTGIRYRDEDE